MIFWVKLGGQLGAGLLTGVSAPMQRKNGAACFTMGQIVALEFSSLPRVYVFRTVLSGTATLPGVTPAVELLIEARSSGRAELLRRLFRFLARRQLDPSSLSDEFYLRVGAVLAGKLRPNATVLSTLLERERHRGAV